MFEIARYTPEQKATWNQFVSHSKNGTFLFDRNYMDYHSDRFEDYSLMIYRKGKLYSLLPANRVSHVLYSHQGLTYGGMIMSDKVTVADSVEMFRTVNRYLCGCGFDRVVYKPIPFIYHQHPAQEDLYALFRTTNAKIIGRNVSSTIYQNGNKLRFSESRRSGIRKSLNDGVSIIQSDDYKAFWDILNINLQNRYGVLPVHSLDEIRLLHSCFPNNIKLYMAYKGDVPLGGSLLYITKQVVHTQYISASVEGKELGALDLLFDCLINKEYASYPYFDFGQSTESMGTVLNESLIFQKEGFGGRGMCYDIYEYEL